MGGGGGHSGHHRGGVLGVKLGQSRRPLLSEKHCASGSTAKNFCPEGLRFGGYSAPIPYAARNRLFTQRCHDPPMGMNRTTDRNKGNGIRAVVSLLTLPMDDPELVLSQQAALSRQIPLLYTILIANATSLAITHARTAPALLTWDVPAVLLIICAIRLVSWLRSRGQEISAEQAIVQLRRTMLGVGVLGVAFTAWALCMFPYGDAYAQCHVAFYTAITVITCIFCLMHLRAAALLLIAIVIPPYVVFFLLTGRPVLVAMAANMALVTFGMIFVLLRNYRDFAALIVSRRELIHRQQETQRLSDENAVLANMDSLTNLPNRRCFFNELQTVLKRAEHDGSSFAVAMLDLDRFKAVNDVHGHAAGDRLLTQVGIRLKRIAGVDIFIARLDGDAFGAILTGAGEQMVANFGARIKAQLQDPFVVGDRLATISCSTGVAIYPQAGAMAEALFERADYALCHGKQTRRGEIMVFSDEHETVIRQSGIIEQVFRSADFDSEMRLAFQPVVDVANTRVVAFEALARWTSPELGEIGPGIFIPIAERTRAINRLTLILLRKALAAALNWPANISICFNLSAYDLGAADTVAAIRGIVAGSGVAPGRIEFEVTETALLSDFEQAAAMIDTLHAMGVRIALDDFGTGFASLGYVHRLPLDKIKIDRSFVTDVDVGRISPTIIKSIVALCRNLDIVCVVEGVETASQLRALVNLGCTFIQGFVLSRPVEADAVTRLIDQIAATGNIAVRPTLVQQSSLTASH
jgi:diguanylate cyclase (GGDEF)-like protein